MGQNDNKVSVIIIPYLWYNSIGHVWSDFSVPNTRCPGAQMSVIQGGPHEPTPNLSIATYGTNGDIFRTLPPSQHFDRLPVWFD